MSISVSSWLCLCIAIVFGVLGTVSMKLSQGFRYLKPSLCLILFYAFSFVALTLAVQTIEVSVVYAIWSGIGTLLVALLSVFLFHEYISVKKFIALLCIIIGVWGVHLSYVFH